MAALLALLDCGSTVKDHICAAGQQLVCDCTDGVTGAQTCSADGSGYDACVCTGGSSSSSGAGGSITSPTGAGGASACASGATVACYSGPAGTEGIGPCHAGTRTCDAAGTAWGSCIGEVDPKPADCSTPVNQACTGPQGTCGASATWSKRFGDAMDGQGANSVALDYAADVLLAGTFAGTADFGGGPLTSTGPNDIFLAKLAPSGAHLWSKHYAANAIAASLAADGLGNVVVTAGVVGAVDLGGGPLGGQDQVREILLAKLDTKGGYLWAKRWADATVNSYPVAVKVAADGNVFLLAQFGDAVDIGCGPTFPPPASGPGLLLAKLGQDGTCVWSKAFGSFDMNAGNLAVDASGNVYVSGAFGSSANLGGGQMGGTNGTTLLFLVKTAPDGTHLYAKTWETGVASSNAPGLATDAAGDVILTGGIGPVSGSVASVDFGNGSLTATSYSSAYVVKFDPSGTALWSKMFGPGYTAGAAATVDPSGDILVAGQLQGSANVGATMLTATNGLYVARFGADGTAKNSHAFDGARSEFLAVDGLSNAVLAGSFVGMLDFGTGALMSTGGSDGFVADVGP